MRHPQRLRFGIPSLDELLGDVDLGKTRPPRLSDMGIHLPTRGSGDDQQPCTEACSLCLLGPDGTGKSVFGLHAVSRYMADCWSQVDVRSADDVPSVKDIPSVLYVSTDLRYNMAHTIWRNFALDKPNQRKVPFLKGRYGANAQGILTDEARNLDVPITHVSPFVESQATVEALPNHLGYRAREKGKAAVGFVDLQAFTAGDDWAFLARLLALLETPVETPDTNKPLHLLVIDSVEGFETLVGERNAFGDEASRRSRIAQIMRAATGKCHVLFIVEESISNHRQPEEFVADIVIRLRSTPAGHYLRRTVEVVKARGQAHVRGEHPFMISKGGGSSTGDRENPDDERIIRDYTTRTRKRAVIGTHEDQAELTNTPQGYVHVFHSLDYLSRKTMETRGGPRPNLVERFAAFGVPYLDDMLAGDRNSPDQEGGSDKRGLPCGTLTALIGDTGTNKSDLGVAFLSRCFTNYIDVLSSLIKSDGSRYPLWSCSLARATAYGNVVEGATELFSLLRSTEPDVLTEADKQRLDKLVRDQRDDILNNSEAKQLAEALANWPCEKDDEKRLRARAFEELKTRYPNVLIALALCRYHPQNSFPVLVTTHDNDSHRMVLDFCKLLEFEKKKSWGDLSGDELKIFRILVQSEMKNLSVCRRLAVHDHSASSLFHVIERCVQRAQEHVFFGRDRIPDNADDRFLRSWRVRLVIDDLSSIKNTFPEIGTESLFLPFLAFHLCREGVTSLIIDTQTGRPETVINDRFDSEIRALAQNHLYTWRVPFYGESRVAIAAIPPVARDQPAVVRELKEAGEGLQVDPHFETYSGLERDDPKPVPLQIRLYSETTAFDAYIEEENALFSDEFAHEPATRVIQGVPADRYETLRDLCSTLRDVKRDDTLVFQVDEFWRSGGLQSQAYYLYDSRPTADFKPDPGVDPFKTFQAAADKQRNLRDETNDPHRIDHFQLNGHAKSVKDSPSREKLVEVDRVPFMWDFGFLLCRKDRWKDALIAPLPAMVRHLEEPTTVEDVWNSLPKLGPELDPGRPSVAKSCSWRKFLEACIVVARNASNRTGEIVLPFEIATPSPESFACLMLEIWMSEIRETEIRTNNNGKSGSQWSQRTWEPPSGREKGLVELVEDHAEDLYRAWLLLTDALNFSTLITRTDPSIRPAANPMSNPVAVRHWYKTASSQEEEFSAADPVVPVRLPGYFSVRGDWFLGVAKGSRSGRLGDWALDLLNSRRGNVRRLQAGLGLPVRHIHGTNFLDELRTRLYVAEKDRKRSVTYSELLRIGRSSDDFNWLWRSRMRGYDRHSRVWIRWLNRCLAWWHDIRFDLGPGWLREFEIYDAMSKSTRYSLGNWEKEIRSGGALPTWTLAHGQVIKADDLKSWKDFPKLCRALVETLEQAET